MTRRRLHRGFAVAAWSATMAAAALYACGGDDASTNTGGSDASLADVANDSSLLDRSASDGGRTDGGGASDAGDAAFLPNVPFVCGGSDCDFAASGCCDWVTTDGSTGQECLPRSEFADGAIPCSDVPNVAIAFEGLCFRPDDCDPGTWCHSFPLGVGIASGCTDAGMGDFAAICDPDHGCNVGLHCFRFTCGPNELAICLNADSGADQPDADPGCIVTR